MTGAELPPSIPHHSRDSRDDVEPAEHALPASLAPWVAALTLWPTFDEGAYRLVARGYGDGREPGWTFLSSLLVHSGIAAPAPDPETYAFREAWLPALDALVDEIGGVAVVKERVLDAWLAQPSQDELAPVARWAGELARWDVYEQIWLFLGEQTTGVSEETLRAIRDLPLEARHARPILTWASGAAASLLNELPHENTNAVLQRLLLDSAMLHANWSVRADSDEAVSAGTFRMIGERRLPSTHAGQSLDAAWRTKLEVDAFIDARSRAGSGPGRTPQAIFRAFSARLALFRFDPLSAINEARWASILADWEPVAAVARGVEALALSVSTDEGTTRSLDPPPDAIGGSLGVLGLRGMGEIYEILADGNEAVRRLDRAALEWCLEIVSPTDAALAGIWAMRVALAGWRDVLWGDVNAGLATLSGDVARLSMLGREHEEPFGATLLDRTRVMLLTKAGAFGAAAQLAERLPDRSRLLASARVHLWAGQYPQAIRIADAAPYQPGLEMAERYRLTLIRSAAALLGGSADAHLRADAVRELKRILSSGSVLHVGLLPRVARDALIELCEPEFDADDPDLAQLRVRLSALNDAAGEGVRPLHLTERETVLLPLLATEESVPEIARRLQVSVNTVRKQVVTLREKFQAESRAELVRKARMYGAIP